MYIETGRELIVRNTEKSVQKNPEKVPQVKEQMLALREEVQLCLEIASLLNDKLQPLIVSYPGECALEDKSADLLCPAATSIKESRQILADTISILRSLLNRIEI